MDQQNKPSQELVKEQPIKFTYPNLIRLILGIGGPAFIAAALYTSPLVREQGLALWVPLFFLLTGLISLILLYIFSGQFVFYNQGVYFRKLGQEINIPYHEVQMIEHQPKRDRLIIRGLESRIIVHKVLKDYVLFYSLLNQFCPDREKEAHLPFPIEIHNHRWLFILPVLLILGGIYGLVMAVQYSYIPLYFFGPMLALINAWLFLIIPHKYIFDARGLTAISLIREKLYRAEDLYELHLNRPYNLYSFTETSLLVLKFETGKVFLQDFAVDFPLEVMPKILYRHYPRLSYGPGSYNEEAETAWPGAGPLSARKRKTNLIALSIAAVILLGVGAILFAARTDSQFQAHVYDLVILDAYPNPGPWIVLRPGPHASSETYHTWIQTSFGLFDPWIVTIVAADDPLEYYQKIDLKIAAVYAMFTVFFAAAGRQGVLSTVRYCNKRARNLENA